MAWKALLSGQATSVLAQVDEGVSFPPGLVFKQNDNTIATQPTSQNHQQQLNLTGQMHEEEGSVEVYASEEEEAELVGKLKTISYDALYQKLVLVVLDNVMDDAPYLARLSREVPAIFAQAGVSLTVESQEFDTEWGDRDVPLEDETTGLLSNYPDQLKRVIKDYRKEHEEEKETAYIFLAGGSSTGKLGYMPKKRAYGFVYLHEHDSGEPVAKTIAHELGHGLFRLEHTFEEYPSLTKGSTDNLMDYGSRGTHLHKYQWDFVHNPQAMLGWFQDEEENASFDFCEVMFKDKLTAIREANLAGKEEVSFNWSGETMDCTPLKTKISTLSLDIAHFQMPMRGSVNFSPSDYKRTAVAKLADLEGEFVRYDFGDFEYQDDHRVMLSVTIMKKQTSELETFLFGEEAREEKESKIDETNSIFTQQQLDTIYANVDSKVIKSIFQYIEEYRSDFGIDNNTKLIHFLAQAHHESGGFFYMKEIGSFSGTRETYKGRGIFQLTFKRNYKAFQQYLKDEMNIEADLVGKPELVEESKYAVLSALWYWKRNNLNKYATDLKKGSLLKLSKLINCGNLKYCGCERDKNNKCKKDKDGNKEQGQVL